MKADYQYFKHLLKWNFPQLVLLW